MIVEADKKIIDLHQEVYLAFYDLTGITVGVVLFVNMLIENALFMLITTSVGVVLIICSFILVFFYYSLHIIQASEKIKLYNEMAINWANNYALRLYFCLTTLLMFAMTGDWRFAFIFCPYVVAMYLPAVKIRERDRDRFKIVKWATA